MCGGCGGVGAGAGGCAVAQAPARPAVPHARPAGWPASARTASAQAAAKPVVPAFALAPGARPAAAAQPQANAPLQRQVQIRNLSSELLMLDDQPLVEALQETLSAFGELERPPTVMTRPKDGVKVGFATFVQPMGAQEAVDSAAMLGFDLCMVQDQPHQPPKQHKATGKGNQAAGQWNRPLPTPLGQQVPALQEAKVPAFQQLAGQFMQQLPGQFVQPAAAQLAQMAGQLMQMQMQVASQLQPVITHQPAPGKTITIYIDELDMPLRPEVEATSTDREVWVDPLPDDEILEDWLLAFGEVEEVARIPNADGSSGEKGYVQFKEHDAAKACVEMRAGMWSESERSLGPQMARRRVVVQCYPDSVVSAFLGKKGADINALRQQAGVWKLAVKGRDIAADPTEVAKGKAKGIDVSKEDEEPIKQRLHFYIEGKSDAIDRVKPELERRLAEIHQEIRDKLEAMGPKKDTKRRRVFLMEHDYADNLATKPFITQATLDLITQRAEAKRQDDFETFARLDKELKKAVRQDNKAAKRRAREAGRQGQGGDVVAEGEQWQEGDVVDNGQEGDEDVAVDDNFLIEEEAGVAEGDAGDGAADGADEADGGAGDDAEWAHEPDGDAGDDPADGAAGGGGAEGHTEGASGGGKRKRRRGRRRPEEPGPSNQRRQGHAGDGVPLVHSRPPGDWSSWGRDEGGEPRAKRQRGGDRGHARSSAAGAGRGRGGGGPHPGVPPLHMMPLPAVSAWGTLPARPSRAAHLGGRPS